MNTIHNQDNVLSENLRIFIGICLRTALITIVGGCFSATCVFIVFDEIRSVMTGGIIPLVFSGVAFFFQLILCFFMTAIPIIEAFISVILLIISRLFQRGELKKWKIIVSNVLVVLVNIAKALFIVYLLILIYYTYKVSLLLVVVFALQIVASVILIVYSFKLIYRPSYKKIKEPQS